MTISGLSESQGVVYQALATAGICSGRISDNPTDDVTFPHVEIGETIADQMTLSGFPSGTDETQILTAWSRERSAQEIKDIVGDIRLALDGQKFAGVAGRDGTVNVYVLDETVRREPDAKTWRAVIRVRLIHLAERV